MFYIPKAIKAIFLSGLIGAISVRQLHLFPWGFKLNCALAFFFFFTPLLYLLSSQLPKKGQSVHTNREEEGKTNSPEPVTGSDAQTSGGCELLQIPQPISRGMAAIISSCLVLKQPAPSLMFHLL